MKINDMIILLDAEVLTPGAGLEREVSNACGSDMMSDVLAYVKNQGVLLTGLNNPQVVRTASMMDMLCVVFVRGKRPETTTLKLAEEAGITVLTSKRTLFSACGLLYERGLRGGS